MQAFLLLICLRVVFEQRSPFTRAIEKRFAVVKMELDIAESPDQFLPILPR